MAKSVVTSVSPLCNCSPCDDAMICIALFLFRFVSASGILGFDKVGGPFLLDRTSGQDADRRVIVIIASSG